MEALIMFASTWCSKAQRSNWRLVLSPLKEGSLERVLWALAFLKSTNGVADKVSCGHFQKLIKNDPNISLSLFNNPYYIVAMLQQTSKWVKNTFVIVNIFRHIQLMWKGEPSRNFHDWIQFNEIGPKTAALLFYAAFGETVALPVDSHVYYAFQQWQWTNAKSEDECS